MKKAILYDLLATLNVEKLKNGDYYLSIKKQKEEMCAYEKREETTHWLAY